MGWEYTICITIFIKIVILDNKINHPGKRQKNKTFVACFLGFLIGKMSIYAECKKKLQFLFLMIFYGQTRNASEQYTFIYVLYYWWTKRDIQKWNSIKVKLFGLNTYPTSNLTIYRQLCLDMIWIVILKRVDLLLHQKNHFILLNVHRYLCRKCIKNGNWLKQ